MLGWVGWLEEADAGRVEQLTGYIEWTKSGSCPDVHAFRTEREREIVCDGSWIIKKD